MLHYHGSGDFPGDLDGLRDFDFLGDYFGDFDLSGHFDRRAVAAGGGEGQGQD